MKTFIPRQPWWLLYVRSSLFVLIGVLLFVQLSQYSLTSTLFIGACLLSSGLLAIRFWQTSLAVGASNFWILVNGSLDALVGIGLLLYHTTDPAENIALLLGGWGVLVGVFGAVETMFVFLGVQQSSRAARDFGIILLSFLTLGLGGGLAFLLISQPLGFNSIRYGGLLIIAIGVLLLIETRRLQRDAQLEERR